MTDTTTRRPGGRSARVKGAVHRAVFELLQESAWEDLTIAAVAERSGVHQATIYRRWRSIPGLINEVVTAELSRTSPIPDTGTLRGDLEILVSRVAELLAQPSSRIFLRASLVATNAESAQAGGYMIERGEQLTAMFKRAAARGEPTPDREQFISIVMAPLYFNAIFLEPLDRAQALRLIDRLLWLVESGFEAG